MKYLKTHEKEYKKHKLLMAKSLSVGKHSVTHRLEWRMMKLFMQLAW